jgi:hypothetical protein
MTTQIADGVTALWITEKQNRIAEYLQHYDDIPAHKEEPAKRSAHRSVSDLSQNCPQSRSVNDTRMSDERPDRECSFVPSVVMCSATSASDAAHGP